MGAYADEIASAAEMIAEAGCTVELAHFDPVTAPNADKPWATTRAGDWTEEAKAVFLSAESRLSDGTLIHQGEQKVLLAALGLEAPPNVKGEIRVDDVRWRILSVSTLAPGGEPILYELRVAR